MQQKNLHLNNLNVGFFIGGAIIHIIFLFGIYTFFESTAIAAKLLAASGSILSLVIVIPFWLSVFHIVKQERQRKKSIN